CVDRAEHRDLETSNDEIREPVAASNTVAVAGLVVVGIDRVDPLHTLWKRRRHREGQCAADRLADDRDVREIELLDEVNDGLPEVGLVETRAWIDWRVSVARKVNGVHRVRSGEEGRKSAEIFELRPYCMYEEQRRPAADLLKAYAQRIRYLEQTWFDFSHAEHSISPCFEGALQAAAASRICSAAASKRA